MFGDIVTMINDFKDVLSPPRPAHLRESVAGQQGRRADDARGEIARRDPEGRTRAGVAACCATASALRGAGLSLLESPGNDGVSSTAMVVSGATLLLFTTGRGTPLGFPVPTIKVSSNSEIAREEAALDRLQRRRAARRHEDDGAARGRSVRADSRRRVGDAAREQREERLSRDRDLEGRSDAVDGAPGLGCLASSSRRCARGDEPRSSFRRRARSRCRKRSCSSARARSCAASSSISSTRRTGAAMFDGSIVAVSSTGSSRDAVLNEQEGLFTLAIQGIEAGRRAAAIASCRSLSRAHVGARRVGRGARAGARSGDRARHLEHDRSRHRARRIRRVRRDPPPRSFPGKLTRFLARTRRAFDYDPQRGVVVLPCELIEDNGDTLRAIVAPARPSLGARRAVRALARGRRRRSATRSSTASCRARSPKTRRSASARAWISRWAAHGLRDVRAVRDRGRRGAARPTRVRR